MSLASSTPPSWIVPRESEKPVIARLDFAPEMEAMPERARQKARKGEPYRFPLDVSVEATSQTGKLAKVAAASPGSAHFEIYSDEGQLLGGEEAGPTPLAYFTAGVGFCLMTHITGYLRHTGLQITRLKIEMRGNYHTTLGHVERGNQGIGGCDGFETYVLIDSNEPSERLKEFLKVCEEACIASQTIAHAIPTEVRLVLNGAEQTPA